MRYAEWLGVRGISFDFVLQIGPVGKSKRGLSRLNTTDVTYRSASTFSKAPTFLLTMAIVVLRKLNVSLSLFWNSFFRYQMPRFCPLTEIRVATVNYQKPEATGNANLFPIRTLACLIS